MGPDWPRNMSELCSRDKGLRPNTGRCRLVFMAVLSFQSEVASGHVGNSAAVPAFQQMGVECWPITTASFTNHPAHRSFSGGPVLSDQVAELFAEGMKRGRLKTRDAVLSGFVGEAATADVIADAVSHVRAASLDAKYFCDPVMAHEDGLFVANDVASAIKATLLPLADFVFPNQFELEFLSGKKVETLDDVSAACAALFAIGPRAIICTSIRVRVTPPDKIMTICATPDSMWVIETPHLPGPLHGAGDLFAALFVGHYLASDIIWDGSHMPLVTARAVSSAYGVLKATGAALDLALIPNLKEITAPSDIFSARQIR